MAAIDVLDLVVIGGGTSGIAAARFYLETHPQSRIKIIERDGAVGGVWSKGMRNLNPLFLSGFKIYRKDLYWLQVPGKCPNRRVLRRPLSTT
jgi:cation diffusion facilitator CzcD-associated flavoprotein CzcO